MPQFGLFGSSAPTPALAATGGNYAVDPQAYKPSWWDYALDMMLKGQTPDETNQVARQQYLGALGGQAQLGLYNQAMSALMRAGQPQQGQQAPQMPQDGSQAAGQPQPAQSGPGGVPGNSGDFAGVPTAAQAYTPLMALGMVNPDLAKRQQELVAGSQPTYKAVNGRMMRDNGPTAGSQLGMPENSADVGYVADPNSPTGYRAAAVPNAAQIAAYQAGTKSLATGMKPPIDGATPVVSGYDPITGIPNVTGWRLPNGTTLAINQGAAARAQGEGTAKPYVIPGATGQGTLTNETDAAGGGGAAGAPGAPGAGAPHARTVGAQFGTQDRYQAAEKNYQAVQADRSDAQGTLANIDQLTGLLGQMSTGRLAPTGNEIAGVAQSLGLPGDYSKLSNAQAMAAVNANMIGGLRKQAGFTRMTNADLAFLNKGMTNIQNTPQGNSLALGYMKAMAQRRVVRAQAADAWVQKYGSLAAQGQGGPNFDAAFASWQSTHPIFGSHR